MTTTFMPIDRFDPVLSPAFHHRDFSSARRDYTTFDSPQLSQTRRPPGHTTNDTMPDNFNDSQRVFNSYTQNIQRSPQNAALSSRSSGTTNSPIGNKKQPRSILRRSTSAYDVKAIKASLKERPRSFSLDDKMSRLSITPLFLPRQSQSLISITLPDPDDSPKSVHFPEKPSEMVEVFQFVPSGERLNELENFDFSLVSKKKKPQQKLVLPPELLVGFREPFEEPNFQERLMTECVVLERAATRNRTITGVIAVKNISFEKDIFVRYTIDSWRSSSDTSAQYVPNSTDQVSDRFLFNLTLPKSATGLEFAICYRTAGQEFWDSNQGKNYKVVDSLSTRSTPS